LMPLWPRAIPSQNVAAFNPSGLTTPIPVSTTRLDEEDMGTPRRKSGTFRAVGQDLCQSQQVLQLAAKNEIVIPEQLLRARLVEMGEDNLPLRQQLALGI